MATATKTYKLAFPVYSPRWEHDDQYLVEMTPDAIKVTRGMNYAECNGELEWTGYGGEGENPLLSVFSNDQIYAPSGVPTALEYAWMKWRDNSATDAEVTAALTELFAWISQTAKNTPDSAFWQGAF
jgi:hypothetical protein